MIKPDSLLLNVDPKILRIANVMKNQYVLGDIEETEKEIRIEISSKNSYSVILQKDGDQISQISCSCSMGDQCFHKAVVLLLLKDRYSSKSTTIIEQSPWRTDMIKLTELIQNNNLPTAKELIDSKLIFVIELDYFGWRIAPYLENLFSGDKIKLTPSMLEEIVYSCSSHEQNIIAYLLFINRFRHKNMFEYSEKIGFILDWLKNVNTEVVDITKHNRHFELEFVEEKYEFSLHMDKRGSYATIFPCLNRGDEHILMDDSFKIMTLEPMTVLFRNRLYFVNSFLNTQFWHNFKNSFRALAIPEKEMNMFFRDFLPGISRYIHLNKLIFPSTQLEIPLREKFIELTEIEDEIWIKIYVEYGGEKYPLIPGEKVIYLYKNNSLVELKRDLEKENDLINFLYSIQLEFVQGKWMISKLISPLEWLLNALPLLKEKGFHILNLDTFEKYKVIPGDYKIAFKFREKGENIYVVPGITYQGEFVPIKNLNSKIKQNKNFAMVEPYGYISFDEIIADSFSKLSHLSHSYSSQAGFKLDKRNMWIVADVIDKVELHAPENLVQELKRIKEFKSIEMLPQPKSILGELRDYQKAGFAWLHFLHQMNFGGILADDMGLGKTVQIITMLAQLKDKNELHHPALIIVPTTLVENWNREFQKFAPHMKILVYKGLRNNRLKALEKKDYDVVIMSYGLILLDYHEFHRYNFSYLILDESQKVKNPDTKTYKAIQTLQIPHKIALTGTPIENSIADLWAQMNLVMPGYLGSLQEFLKKFENGKTIEESFVKLRKIIQPFILRRKKEDVTPELPEKTEIDQVVEMTEKQRTRYHEAIELFRNKIQNAIEERGIKGASRIILEALTYLRQMAVHPHILDHNYPIDESGKWQLLFDMIQDIVVEDHKILIFSQYVRFLKLIRRRLDELGLEYSYIDGQTRNRMEEVDKFQMEPDVKIFLLSLKAGGFGLNLTAADYIFILDPWWNPAVENQAIDRAYRIGQDKNIFVYRFITTSSIEEKIIDIQKNKLKLSETILPEDSELLKNLSRDDVLGLLMDQ
jgi:SNF2 family DNA or RNA helicase